jgi:hypothetical protein
MPEPHHLDQHALPQPLMRQREIGDHHGVAQEEHFVLPAQPPGPALAAELLGELPREIRLEAAIEGGCLIAASQDGDGSARCRFPRNGR